MLKQLPTSVKSMIVLKFCMFVFATGFYPKSLWLTAGLIVIGIIKYLTDDVKKNNVHCIHFSPLDLLGMGITMMLAITTFDMVYSAVLVALYVITFLLPIDLFYKYNADNIRQVQQTEISAPIVRKETNRVIEAEIIDD